MELLNLQVSRAISKGDDNYFSCLWIRKRKFNLKENFKVVMIGNEKKLNKYYIVIISNSENTPDD